MLTIVFLFIFGMSNTSKASWFSWKKPAADAEGNCLAEVIKENAMLFAELQALSKIGERSEAQGKNPSKESQILSQAGFKELSAKAKNTRVAIQKFGSTYGAVSCKAMVKGKLTTLNVKELADSHEKFAIAFEKMAEDWLKPIARK